MSASNGLGDGKDVVIIDETNSITAGPGPADEWMRNAIRNRLEKERKLLELMKKLNEKNGDGPSGSRNQSGNQD